MSVLNLPCSICSQTLRNVYEISGANCGHLFHAKCLSASQYNGIPTRCPKCQLYTPVMYKLYETPDDIASINALEYKVQTLTTEKGKLENDLGISTKKFLDLRTESEKEITKLRTDVVRENLLNDLYKKRISHLQCEKEEFANHNKQLSGRQATSVKEIEQLKTEKSDLTKQKVQLETELHAKNSQYEECAKKLYLQYETYKIQTSNTKVFVKENEQLRKEIDLKNKQLIELQIACDMAIAKYKAETQHAYNKELNDLRKDVNAKTMQLTQMQSKYSREMENLKSELRTNGGKSKQQEVEMEKLTNNIISLNEQNTRQSNDMVVLSRNLATKLVQAKKETESPNTNLNEVLKETEQYAGGIASTVAVNSNGNDNREINLLKEKLKTLHQKIDFMSGELNKEISKSTQLEVENFKLQSYVDCLKKEIPFNTHENKVVQNITTNPSFIMKNEVPPNTHETKALEYTTVYPRYILKNEIPSSTQETKEV